MANITQWSEGELETFSHKLEEVIHGLKGHKGQVGFIMIAFPITDEARARMMSNVDGQMVVNVLYQVLKGLVDREKKH